MSKISKPRKPAKNQSSLPGLEPKPEIGFGVNKRLKPRIKAKVSK